MNEYGGTYALAHIVPPCYTLCSDDLPEAEAKAGIRDNNRKRDIFP